MPQRQLVNEQAIGESLPQKETGMSPTTEVSSS